MKNIKKYEKLLLEKGIPFPETNYIALGLSDSLIAIEYIKEANCPIYGGDIVSINEHGRLFYAYQLWGDTYHYLNWYCSKKKFENNGEYCERSYIEAENSINKANIIAQYLAKECYIIFII